MHVKGFEIIEVSTILDDLRTIWLQIGQENVSEDLQNLVDKLDMHLTASLELQLTHE